MRMIKWDFNNFLLYLQKRNRIDENVYKILVGKIEGRDYFKYQGADGEIILKWILNSLFCWEGNELG